MTSLRERAAALLKQPYTRLIVPEEDGSYRAEIAEFPGCITLAENSAEALADLEDIAVSWLEAALEKNQAIPKPMGNAEFSGKLVLRLPKSLHKKVAQAAERDGVSLNQFLVGAVAEHVGAKSAEAPAQLTPIVIHLSASVLPTAAIANTSQRYAGEFRIRRTEELRYAGN